MNITPHQEPNHSSNAAPNQHRSMWTTQQARENVQLSAIRLYLEGLIRL